MPDGDVTFRTSDGFELELPLYLDCWLLVPLELAHEEGELTWALEYRDAPELMLEEALDSLEVDEELDFSSGALLVPVDRWHERMERQLVASAAVRAAAAAPVEHPSMDTLATPAEAGVSFDQPPASRRSDGRLAAVVDEAWWLAFVATRLVGAAFLALATVVVGAFLLGLRDGVVLDDVVAGIVLLVGCWMFGRAAGRLGSEGGAAAFAVLAVATGVGLIAGLAGLL